MSRVLPYNAKQWEIPFLLDGRRTVARRVIKPQPKGIIVQNTGYKTDEWGEMKNSATGGKYFSRLKLLYQPGDILYVRETWNRLPYTGEYIYKADDKDNRNIPKGEVGHIIWRPSIHMPKEAVRIWLKCTDVRVERLQEITEEQAQAEGCNSGMLTGPCSARWQFEELWDFTLKKSDLDRYGWNANPWVWVIEFERCEKPENL